MLDLNKLAFEKLKQCRRNKNNIINFCDVYLRLCRQFSIKKGDCQKLLMDFKNEGKIEYVRFKGIKVLN